MCYESIIYDVSNIVNLVLVIYINLVFFFWYVNGQGIKVSFRTNKPSSGSRLSLKNRWPSCASVMKLRKVEHELHNPKRVESCRFTTRIVLGSARQAMT